MASKNKSKSKNTNTSTPATAPAAAPVAAPAPVAPAVPATVADVLAPVAPVTGDAPPADGAAAEPAADPVKPIERQTERCQRIAGVLSNLIEFANKVPNVQSAAWGEDLRTALSQADAGIAAALVALGNAPADYKHPRSGGKADIGEGDSVQISESFRDEYKSLLADVEFGTTAIGIVKSVDEKNRAAVWFAGGAIRVLITTRRLSHAGAVAPVVATATAEAPPSLADIMSAGVGG